MDEVQIICPLTKKELPNTCLTCNFCIKENNERHGCAIRKQVRMFFKYKENAKDFLKTTTKFKDVILNGD
jgi:hypothetical protein